MLGKTLISRAILLNSIRNGVMTQTKRNAGGSWAYRSPPAPPSRKSVLIAEVGGALAWWWIFWHILTEPEHVYGEWPYVDPSTWTDEELGIPPDSAGLLKKINPN